MRRSSGPSFADAVPSPPVRRRGRTPSYGNARISAKLTAGGQPMHDAGAYGLDAQMAERQNSSLYWRRRSEQRCELRQGQAVPAKRCASRLNNLAGQFVGCIEARSDDQNFLCRCSGLEPGIGSRDTAVAPRGNE